MSKHKKNKITTVNNKITSNRTIDQLGGKYLTFFLTNEEFGFEILNVVEIIGIIDVRAIPHTPDYIKGIINLRGKIIPVMDLRLKFGMEELERTNETVIIVVQTHNINIGVIVDKVSEVADISSENIDNTPDFGIDINTDYILGIGKSENNVLLLLDINKIISTQDIIDIHSAQIDANLQEQKIVAAEETK